MGAPRDAGFRDAPTITSGPEHASDDVRPTAPFSVGQRVGGRYWIRGFLGEGGMGAVYRALDETLDVEVALKLVPGAVADGARRRDEVRLAQQVTHPNVCRTYDLEDIDGRHVIKMEYIDGETLSARLAREPRLPVTEALRIARATAAGLGAAHARRIVHRDLKPSNIMLADHGRVVLMDFGIALAAEGAAGGVAGTVGYMAPEQLAGAAVDARADLYALGCVVFEMLAGARLFAGARGAPLAARHASDPPPDLRAIRPEVPRWLARAVRDLLAEDRGPRARGVSRLVAGPPRRWPYAVAAASVAAAVAGLAWPGEPRPWRPRIHELAVFEENGDEPTFSPDGARLAYLSNRERPDEFRVYVADADGADPRAISPPGSSYSYVRWARDGASLLVSDTAEMARIPVDGGSPVSLGRGIAPAPCGDDLVFVRAGSQATELVRRAPDGSERVLLAVDQRHWLDSPRCDARGERVLVADLPTGDRFGSQGQLWLVEGDAAPRALDGIRALAGASFARDGRSVVYTTLADHRFRLFERDLDGGAPHPITTDDTAGAHRAPDVSRDGRRLVFDVDTTTAVLVEQRGVVSRTVSTRDEVLLSLRAVPGSDVVIAERVVPDGHEIVRIRVGDGDTRVLAHGRLPIVSRDGATVYFVDDQRGTVLDAVPVAGGEPRVVATLPGEIVEGAAGYDGPHVGVLVDHQVRSWRIGPDGPMVDAEDGSLVVPLRADGPRVVVPRGRADHVVIARPGRSSLEIPTKRARFAVLDDHRIAVVVDQTLRVIDADGGEELGRVPLAGTVQAVVLAPDGETVYTIAVHGHVVRHVVENFGERPWR